MPAPSNASGLSLGRAVIDPTTIDTMDDVRENFGKVYEHFVGAGFPCGAQDGDNVYLAVYAQPDGDEYLLWGGNPTDPLNPTLLTLSLAGSATVVWQDEGVTQVTAGIVDFQGAGVTLTDGGSKAIVTIPGGSGTPYTEGNGIDIDGSNVVSAELATNRGLEFDGSGLAVNIGDGLEMSTNDIVVKAHTYIDVTSNGVAVDFTEVASYNGASDQYLRNNAGTLQWATLPPDTNTTYTAGAGMTLSSTKFIADPHDASHVGLVDPTTGDDSSADDAQIGILWHEIASYDSTKNMLVGHAANDTSKPVVEYKTVADWLKTLPSYDAAKKMVLTADAGTVEWNEVDDVLNWLAGYVSGNYQSIGHDVAGATEWQDDSTECP